MSERALDMDEVGPKLYQVFTEIGIIAQLSGRAVERALPNELTFAAYSVLNHFVRHERPESPSRLAAAFQISKAAMAGTLKRLAEAGYIDFILDPSDARSKLAVITDAGRAVHRDTLAGLGAALDGIARSMDAQRLIDMLPILRDLRQSLDEARNHLDFPDKASP